MKYFTLLISIILFNSLNAQKLSVNPYFAIGVESLDYKNVLGPNIIRQLGDDIELDSIAYSSWIFKTYGFELDYDIFKCLNLSLDINYQNGGYEKDQVGSKYTQLDIQDFRLNPKLAFDILFKEEYEKLLLSVGGNIGWRKHQEDYGFDGVNSNGTAQRLDYSMQRSGNFLGLTVGLEWQDYFSPRFGYSLGLDYFFPYKIRYKSLLIETYKLDGNSTNTEGEEYEYPLNQFNSGNEEEMYQQGTYVRIGLLYRIF